MSRTQDFDVIVIGAGEEKCYIKRPISANSIRLGISGIYAAKFYLDIHPECRLAILDKDQYVGGTWNSSRLP